MTGMCYGFPGDGLCVCVCDGRYERPIQSGKEEDLEGPFLVNLRVAACFERSACGAFPGKT